ncbi:MAG: hypothetical protein ACOYNL_03235 [Rickettsiales bacterium]
MTTRVEEQPIREIRARDAREGSPAGTYFAVGALIALLLAVAVYFVAVSGSEVDTSPVVTTDSTMTRSAAPTADIVTPSEESSSSTTGSTMTNQPSTTHDQ